MTPSRPLPVRLLRQDHPSDPSARRRRPARATATVAVAAVALGLLVACGGGGGGGGGTKLPTVAVVDVNASNDLAHDIAMDGMGRLVMAGFTDGAGANTDIAIWRGSMAGDPDPTFGTGGLATHAGAAGGSGIDIGWALALDSGGRIFVAGESDGPSGDSDLVVVAFDANGVLDTTFGINGVVGFGAAFQDDAARDVMVDASDRIVVTGDVSSAATGVDMILLRYDANGMLDTGLAGTGVITEHDAAGGMGNDTGRGLAMDPAGSIFVTGSSDNGTDLDMIVWKYDGAGSPDATFAGGQGIYFNVTDPLADDEGRAVGVDPTGFVYVAAETVGSKGATKVALWRIDATGVLDPAFGSGGWSVPGYFNAKQYTPRNMTFDSLGRIVVVGSAFLKASVHRFEADGKLESKVLRANSGPGTSIDAAFGVVPDALGGVFVAGGALITSNSTTDVVVWRRK